MYIDFEDYRPEILRVERALTPLELILISVVFHLVAIIMVLLAPRIPILAHLMQQPTPVPVAVQQQHERPTFVFMSPKVDISKPQPKQNVDASDQDRIASSIEKPPNPKNDLPFSRGNTHDRVEQEPTPRTAQRDAQPAPGPQSQQPPDNQVASNDPAKSMLRMPQAPSATMPALNVGGQRSGANGVLGDAIKNLQRYTQQSPGQTFDNPQGNGEGQGLIQFDSKGVEFGPWLRRFVAQVKRNWFIPTAAMMLKGHVVITFNVHKDGAITDIEVKGPSGVDAFDRAAVNALISSNPTVPLPPEYPADKAFFTVTFLYNETPPPGQYAQ